MGKTLIVLTIAISALVATAAAASAVVVSAQQRPRAIPDRVMLQPDDFEGSKPGPVEAGLTWSLLPQPCADRPVPQPVASRSQAADYRDRFRIYQNVAKYRGDGAQRYVAELKAQLAACGVGGAENGYDPVAEDHLGPDTVLFQGNYNEGDRTVGYVVAAVDEYVVVVMMSDSYLGQADLTSLNGLANTAMKRAAA